MWQIPVEETCLACIALLLVYTVLNPYYFRVALASGTRLSVVEAVSESFTQAVGDSGVPNVVMGLHNVAQRVVGLEMLDVAIALVGYYPYPNLSATAFLNEFLNSSWYSNAAPGHFGYFIIAAGSVPWGLLLGFAALGLFLMVAIRFDRAYMQDGRVTELLLGLTFVTNILVLLIDGDYPLSSNYIQLVFNMVAVYFLSRWLVGEGKPVTNHVVS